MKAEDYPDASDLREALIALGEAEENVTNAVRALAGGKLRTSTFFKDDYREMIGNLEAGHLYVKEVADKIETMEKARNSEGAE